MLAGQKMFKRQLSPEEEHASKVQQERVRVHMYCHLRGAHVPLRFPPTHTHTHTHTRTHTHTPLPKRTHACNRMRTCANIGVRTVFRCLTHALHTTHRRRNCSMRSPKECATNGHAMIDVAKRLRAKQYTDAEMSRGVFKSVPHQVCNKTQTSSCKAAVEHTRELAHQLRSLRARAPVKPSPA